MPTKVSPLSRLGRFSFLTVSDVWCCNVSQKTGASDSEESSLDGLGGRGSFSGSSTDVMSVSTASQGKGKERARKKGEASPDSSRKKRKSEGEESKVTKARKHSK